MTLKRRVAVTDKAIKVLSDDKTRVTRGQSSKVATNDRSRPKRGSTFTGNAGEHYVMAELLKRGVVAALAPRNTPDFDILASRERRTVHLRVKTKSEHSPGRRFRAKKDGSVFFNVRKKDDYIVFVNLADDARGMACYIAETSRVDRWLREDHRKWLATPSKSGQAHRDTSVRRILLAKYRDKLSTDWNMLWRRT